MVTRQNFFTLCAVLMCCACSDMSADSDEIAAIQAGTATQTISDYPADFNTSVYSELNQDIAYEQILADLRNNGYYNPARMDSMSAVTSAGTPDTAVRNPAKAPYAADNAVFLSDTAFAHKVFLMAGYSDSLWKGGDSLNSEQKKYILRFNRQQTGLPSLEEDRNYIPLFAFDSSLIKQHYLFIGAMNGRPYRYCTESSEMGMEKSELTPDTLKATAKILSYSAYRFCYDRNSGKSYAIK